MPPLLVSLPPALWALDQIKKKLTSQVQREVIQALPQVLQVLLLFMRHDDGLVTMT
jgi:hypothetical protein